MSLKSSDSVKDIATKDTFPNPKVKRSGQVAGWLQIVLVVGVLLAGLGANAILSNTDKAPRQKVAGSSTIPVEVIQPNIEDIPFKVTGAGVIQSRNAIAVSYTHLTLPTTPYV